MDNVRFSLTVFAALGSGLMAGVFFAFSVFIMRALARIPASQGIAAMQSINVAVINHMFLLVFLGTTVLCLGIAITLVRSWDRPGAIYLLSGSILYVVGTFLVTIAFNVPRNNVLASVDPASAEGARLWADYLASWTAWNHVRTIAALAAAACLILGLHSARA